MVTAVKGEIDSDTIIVEDFYTSLSSMDRSSRQKTSKEIQDLNDTKNIMYLIDIYKTFRLKVAE